MNKISLFIIFAYMTSVCILYSNEPVPYRLINSDHLQAFRTGDEYITRLRGNVHFFYDNIEFKADRADIYDVQQHVILSGNVVIIQDTLSMTALEAQYFHQTQLLRAQGNVVMTETDCEGAFRRVTSNIATHHRDTGEFILQGNVHASDFRDSLFATAGHAFFNQQDGYGYLIQRPVVWRTGDNPLSMSAEKIEFFQENNKVVASFNVVTHNDDIRATCNFLIYYGDEGRVIYIGEPRFYSESGDGHADLITIYLDGNDVREIVMEGNSFIYFRAEAVGEKDNWVSSNNMVLLYSDNRPSEFIARENVQSFIRQVGASRRQAMINDVAGESLTISFDENADIDQLNITERIRGKYRFERRR